MYLEVNVKTVLIYKFVIFDGMLILHDAWRAWHLDNTWSQKRKAEQHRSPRRSTRLSISRSQSPDFEDHSGLGFCSHPPGLCYPRPRPSSISFSAIWTMTLWSDHVHKPIISAPVLETSSARNSRISPRVLLSCSQTFRAFVGPAYSLTGNSCPALATYPQQISYFPHPAWSHMNAVNVGQVND